MVEKETGFWAHYLGELQRGGDSCYTFLVVDMTSIRGGGKEFRAPASSEGEHVYSGKIVMRTLGM